MKATERERHDWIIIPLILVIGFLCVIVAAQSALRFSPSWKLDANMGSKLDPNSDFLTQRPDGFVAPVDPSILTQPAWINLFLTPGASFVTGTPFPTVTATLPTEPTTIAVVTNTVVVTGTSPSTLVVFLPTPTPNPTKTNRPAPIYTSTSTPMDTSTPTSIFTPTATQTFTGTSTGTFTATATPTSTSTQTPNPGEPDFGGPDGNTIILGNGITIEFNLSGLVLDGNSTWDVVYYEMEETSSAGKIHLGAVQIEVYDQTTSAWYTIYNWGDGVADANASYNNGNSEPDGFPIDKSLLYGASPLNTGIAIDIDTPAIGQGGSIGDSITKIRITSLSNTNCDVDSLQMLR